MKQKQELIQVLNQALESNSPMLFEKAVIITGELIDIDFLNKN